MMCRRPNENRTVVSHFRALSPVGSGLIGLQPLISVGFLFLASALLGSDVSMESEGEAAHWAFRPLTSRRAIEDEAQEAGKSVVDCLIEASLEERGLEANGPADKYTLIRRVTFDLTGLPPTREEIEVFVEDTRVDAYSHLVDRLLASPAYGERWGRYWLDLARYADSNGADENHGHPNAWRYRDYVIRALNQDKPYDRFIKEQLAGDLLSATGSLEADQDQLIATGFLALGPKMLAEQDKGKMLMDVADEQIDVVSKTFMGLTMSCARCHDHKFDPILQEDYFAMAGVFLSAQTMANTNHVSRWVEVPLEGPEADKVVQNFERELAAAKAAIVELESAEATEEREARLKELRARVKRMESEGAPVPKTMSVKAGEPRDVAVHVRGDHTNPRDTPTPRGVNRLLDERLPAPDIDPTSGGRMELAEWLTDPRHPLTARVMVNRIWQGHFGFGLVRTPSNFGLRGEPPTHPRLLDWLAHEFMENGWSIKRMHRLILHSDAYRRSSESNHISNALEDPENRYLWRQNRRRLEAEPIRDALLFVSSKLDQARGLPFGPEEKVQGVVSSKEDRFERRTRSIYLPVIRTNGYDLVAAFDGADPSMHHQKRATSVVPSQALFMMNSPVVLNTSEDLAEELAHENPESVGIEQRLNELYLRLYSRHARAEEIRLMVDALGSNKTTSPTASDWARVCRTLIAANEFIYIN